ncbi:uncharacterized protein MONOS_13148 [Monocercomonoides exilis]|uniref:uncharacterized protein n=1 Tax=Monocercomonoides exilis TaxID=2049356 RepID=UPI003559786E|nr:hypothetical protein MONOS_13148 [Monocercomonoides exilis]|eukprot:MONOS_13148.1-p1 / transcript=MONOS_13148.1 / gene=MONOS_13148 / organism=Monocercomonoides_exilis_PA203 / gene_product=unspecified product / transcript_product=unspecified product / location=Mono_scaffold00783:10924-12410(-) / protein_length=465 / sequence_SO=supercontig / SO=protein_coding / is_pseudo=false
MLLCLTEWFSQQELEQDFSYRIKCIGDNMMECEKEKSTNLTLRKPSSTSCCSVISSDEDEAADQMYEEEESDEEESESDEDFMKRKEKKCNDIKGGKMEIELEKRQTPIEALGNPFSILSTVPQIGSFFQFPPSLLFPTRPCAKESRSYVQVLCDCGRELFNFGASCALASVCQCLASFGVTCDVKRKRGGAFIFGRLFRAIRSYSVTSKIWGTKSFKSFIERNGGSITDPMGITTAYNSVLNSAATEGCNIKKDFTVKQSSFKLCGSCNHVRVHNQCPSLYVAIHHPSIIEGLNQYLTATEQTVDKEFCIDSYCGRRTVFWQWNQIDRFPKILSIYHSFKDHCPLIPPPKTITFNGNGSTPKSMVVKPGSAKQQTYDSFNFPQTEFSFIGYILHSMKPLPIGHFIAVVVDGIDESTGELRLLECNDGLVSRVNSKFFDAYWKAMANEGWSGAMCFCRINQTIE